MKIKVKFKGVNSYGKIVHFTKEIECPDFKVIPPSVYDGIELLETSINRQIMDWLDEQDKSDIMISKDLYLILDYYIPEKKIKTTLKDLLINLDLSEKLMIDILAIYKEIKPLLKNKSAESQLEIILSHLKVGYKASTNSYDRILKILKAPNSNEARLLIDNVKTIEP
jgi:hypothetical protein